nr:MAG TPA: hypothetical protein [Caudoviricetes sp.]
MVRSAHTAWLPRRTNYREPRRKTRRFSTGWSGRLFQWSTTGWWTTYIPCSAATAIRR